MAKNELCGRTLLPVHDEHSIELYRSSRTIWLLFNMNDDDDSADDGEELMEQNLKTVLHRATRTM